MEQCSQYLMWVESKNNILINSFNHSWEEQAFAEDASGPLGGFVWPPRSYSCSFCRREFRSAQALGGHMNIHRRERAKLKQSLNGNTTSTTTTITTISRNASQQSLFKLLLESQNPTFFPSPQSPSRVSSIPVVGQETLCSNSDTKSCVCDEAPPPGHENGTAVDTNLFLGFELYSSGNCSNSAYGGCDYEEVMNCKRQKTAVVPLIMGSTEEVDLELRLAR